MKAIILARVSTEEQCEAGNSLPAQIARLERYCQNKNFSIMHTYSFDESAYSTERSEFDRIIDLILNQKEKVAICCDKVDRLSRNVFDKRISVLYEKALSDELELHFVSDGQIITSHISAVEKFQFSISLGLAKYYSDAISDNVKRAMEQKLRKGEWPSKAPYGYKNITTPQGTDIVVDEYAMRIVQKAFELYATGAYSIDLLRQHMQKEYGIVWAHGYVGQLLNKPFYHGEMLVKGKLYPHRYPPIISKSLFDQVQQVKEGFNKRPIKFIGKPYFYRGLLQCAHCGLSITPERHKGFAYYHCTQYNGRHGAKWLREEVLTEQIGEAFKMLQMPADVVAQTIQTLDVVHQEKINFHNQEFGKLTQEHKSLTTMMDNLYLDKLKGRITDAHYDKFYQSFRDQIQEVNARLERLDEAEDNYYITAKYVLNLVNRAYDLFMSSEVEERRQLIKLVLSNLRIEDEKVLWDVQSPFNLLTNRTDHTGWRG